MTENIRETKTQAIDGNEFSIKWIIQGIECTDGWWINLGICERSKKVSIICSDNLTPLIVRNLYIDPKTNRCEEGTRCLDLSCSLNKTIYNTWNMAHRNEPALAEAEFANLIKLCAEWQLCFQETIDSFKWEDRSVMAVFKEPCLIITITKEKKNKAI